MSPPSCKLPMLIAALRNPELYPHAVRDIEVIETHISWVILTGDYAYKLKKPVDLGFLDFTRLEQRRFYCEEELRLNRRLAPKLYLDVVAITGSAEHPLWNGAGTAIEYAVKMRQFPQEALLDRMLERGALTPQYIDVLAARIAAFHAEVEVAGADSLFGTPQRVLQPAMENFRQIRALLDGPADLAALDALQAWTEQQHVALSATFAQRKRDGFVRECHGDMHLGNIALVDGQVTVFDCIEFNADLRWIDVVSEVAFLAMDLMDRKRADLAWRALNAYLEHSGDYEGLVVLRYYLVYRAMVRAKVTCIRAAQAGLGTAERAALLQRYRGYIELAQSLATPGVRGLVINHGLSGSGKTTLSQPILEAIGAVRIRSDIERKRLHGVPALQRSGSGIASDMYAPDATALTYGRLGELAHAVVEAGYTVIVDATFLQRSQRDAFHALAVGLKVAFVICDFRAATDTLRGRVAQRLRHGRDASEADFAVLQRQLDTQQPLAPEEQADVVVVDSEHGTDMGAALTQLRAVLGTPVQRGA
jgi:aminoglycoside phosphotransferase family enzyme/predicted kinase